MSATGRNVVGHERHADDLYETPSWATRAILPHVNLGHRILDPAAGNGALLTVAREYIEPRVMGRLVYSAIEIDETRAANCRRFNFDTTRDDALSLCAGGWAAPTGIIANPPYKLALEFVERALKECRGEVVVLLRLAFLESRGRALFHAENPSDVFVLSQRPSFAHGKTDSCAYAWFRFGPCVRERGYGKIRVLDASKEAS